MCNKKIQNNNEVEEVQPKPKKRGRKPNPDKKNGYFGDEEEQAFCEFIKCDNEVEKNRIFSQKLYPAFTKMIESIIRRYRLFTPSEDFQDTFYDTLGYLIMKADSFDETKGYKAYSYCGTVCKHYLLQKRTKDMQRSEQYLSYDTMFGSNNSDQRSDYDQEKEIIDFNTELINNNIDAIQTMLNPENINKLTENERQVGYALLEILMNWESFFSLSTDRKFNKTSFLYFVKEYTRLETKDIRDAMKKYKFIYFNEKQKLIGD